MDGCGLRRGFKSDWIGVLTTFYIYMKISSFFLRMVLAAGLAGCFAAGTDRGMAEEPVAVSLFNGKDLTGWKAPEPNPFWTVKDGILTGENDPAKKGSMLKTEKSYGDCELECDVRWNGEIDSGLMLRNPEIQMQIGVSRSLKTDMTGCFYTGVYPEDGQAKERAKLLKAGDWNHFKFRAQGEVFTIWINGTEAVSYKNPKYAAPGPVGLQVHGGLVMKVEFKNLTVKELKPN